MESSSVIPNYIFRPNRVVHLILIILGISGLIITLEDGTVSRSEYAVFLSAIFLIIFFILSLKRLLIGVDNHGITHRQIFKETFISWDEIKAADIKVQSHGSGNSFVWILERYNKPSHKIDFVGRTNMQLLADALITKCPTANISQKVKKFAADKNTSLFLN